MRIEETGDNKIVKLFISLVQENFIAILRLILHGGHFFKTMICKPLTCSINRQENWLHALKYYHWHSFPHPLNITSSPHSKFIGQPVRAKCR